MKMEFSIWCSNATRQHRIKFTANGRIQIKDHDFKDRQKIEENLALEALAMSGKNSMPTCLRIEQAWNVLYTGVPEEVKDDVVYYIKTTQHACSKFGHMPEWDISSPELYYATRKTFYYLLDVIPNPLLKKIDTDRLKIKLIELAYMARGAMIL